MADGRCLTEFTSSKLLIDELMKKNSIDVFDNYKFRRMAQENGPDGFSLPLKNAACRTGEPTVIISQDGGGSC